ncbi:trypsin-like serine protease [Methylovulum miyakonense]|uniref:trypsin-like serine protease n=1 Tax=Methylovulum miyakonense TaxID=645578 RepID=UPI00037A7209|nr:trypsin-like serine protease [Methylovulum miyakonense]
MIALTTGVVSQSSNQNVIVAPNYRPDSGVVYKAVLDLKQTPTGFMPQLRGGREAVSNDWPASLYATFKTPEGTAACTAALIGPMVILTAAHCVPDDRTVSFTYQGTNYNTSCKQHHRYQDKSDVSADFALCKIDKPFKEPVGFKYETIDTSEMSRFVNKTLILTGYGCVSDIVENKQTDGKYRIGETIIDETSKSATKLRLKYGKDYIKFYSDIENNNFFTIDDPDKANLCPGDSGGPAFVRRASASGFAQRMIVGVNSRVFYKNASTKIYGSSLVSAIGGPDFLTWAEKWIEDQKVAACGINSRHFTRIQNCRF